MIILDTTCLSEMMRSPRDLTLVTWLDDQAESSLWTTTVCVYEVRYGLQYMPIGARRHAMEAAFDRLVTRQFSSRVAPFDIQAAEAAAMLGAARRLDGRSIDVTDTLIAGIALSRGAMVATRNVRHFADLATGVVDPWADAST